MEWELPNGVHVLFEESNLFRCLRVLVTGQERGVVRAVAYDVRMVLDVTPDTEILEAVQNADTPAERKNAILRAAAGPPDVFLAALHESVSTALCDPDHEVRVAARRFVEETLWEEFIPALDELIDGGGLPEGAGAVQILREMITLAMKHPDAE
ncbi:hypothetical protein [Streptomyces sp. NPDC059455]|uniref:hypothetical protein n=1 Tax=Streptomyces sp. NPDC059455 TaxID=3346837 RepID=UPI0036A54727